MRKKTSTDHGSTWRVLWAAVALSLLLVGVTGYYGITDPGRAQTIVLAFFAHTFGGRAAGVGICLMNEFGWTWTILYNFYLEVLIVFLVYALFVLSVNNYVKLRAIRFMALKMERKARRHQETIRRYGGIGLFLFVMAPLPVTGPVMGSIIGYLLGFRYRVNFSAVFLGTLTAIIFWTVFFDFLEKHLHVIQYILGGIILVAALSYIKTIRDWVIK